MDFEKVYSFLLKIKEDIDEKLNDVRNRINRLEERGNDLDEKYYNIWIKPIHEKIDKQYEILKELQTKNLELIKRSDCEIIQNKMKDYVWQISKKILVVNAIIMVIIIFMKQGGQLGLDIIFQLLKIIGL